MKSLKLCKDSLKVVFKGVFLSLSLHTIMTNVHISSMLAMYCSYIGRDRMLRNNF